MFKTLVWHTLVTSCGITLLGLANSILLSRALGPVGRGEIAAAMLWPNLLIYLSSLGLIASIMYFSALPKSNPDTVFANAVIIAPAQGVVAVLIGFIALPWLLDSQTDAVIGASRLFLAVVPFGLLTQYGVSILQGLMHLKKFNWLRTVLPAGYLLGTVSLLATRNLTLLNIILLQLSLSFLTCLATFVVLVNSGVRLSMSFEGSLAKRMLKYGVKVHVGNVSGVVNMSLDQALLAAMLPSKYLGLYVVGVSAASVAQVFSQAVQMVSTPSIAQRESSQERSSVLQMVFRHYWLFAIVLTLIIAAAIPIAIPLVFGGAFKEAVWPAEVLLLGSLFFGGQTVLSGGAQAMGNPWLSSKANLTALVVTVVLLYLLLPTLGIMGAAIATTSAYFVQLAMVIFGLRSTHGVSLAGLFYIRSGELNSVLDVLALLKGQPRRLASDQS